MNEFQNRLVLRGVLGAMALLAAVTLVPSGFTEFHARLARGAPLAKIMIPFVGMGVGLICLLFAILAGRRVWQRIDLQRRGTRVAAVVTASEECDDLTRLVRYEFRDRQGTPQAGHFRWPNDCWARGDAGQIAYHPDRPDESAWLTAEAPREATPPTKAAGSPRKFFGIYGLLVLGVSLACGATAVYLLWGSILLKGGLAGIFDVIEPWKVFFAWGLASAVAAPVVAIIVALFGTWALVLFTVTRAMLRE